MNLEDVEAEARAYVQRHYGYCEFNKAACDCKDIDLITRLLKHLDSSRALLEARTAEPPQPSPAPPACYTCVWVYERVCRQLAEPSTDDQTALQDIASTIERDMSPAPPPSSDRGTRKE